MTNHANTMISLTDAPDDDERTVITDGLRAYNEASAGGWDVATLDLSPACPMNRGGLGARSLNIELQKMLNPPGEIRIERFGWTFCPGDKVMQIENDYDREVYNGDLGIVSRIDMEEGEITVGLRGPRGGLRLWRTRRAGARLCDDNPQKSGLRISCRSYSAGDTALRNAAAKPGLHRRDARQTTGRPGRTAQGAGDRGQGSADETTMVKAGRVVGDAISGQCVKTDPICEIAARPPSRRIQGGRLASRVHDKSGRHPDLWNVRRSELEERDGQTRSYCSHRRGSPGDCERALLSAPFPGRPGRDVVEGQGH